MMLVQEKSNNGLIEGFLQIYVSSSTKESYRVALRTFTKFLNKPLPETVPMDVENYYHYLNDSPYKKKSKMLMYSAVVSFFKHYLHLQALSANLGFQDLHYVLSIKRRWREDAKRTPKTILTNTEIKMVLLHLKELNYKHYISFYILADTAMRVNGLCNLKIANINLKKRFTDTFDKGKMRTYVLGKNLKRDLQIYLNIREKISPIYKNEYLFFTNKNSKLITRYFQYIFKNEIAPIVKEITGKWITPQRLRTSFKTNRLNLGQDEAVVKFLMNQKVYLDEYTSPTDDMRRGWFDEFEQL